MNEEKKYKLIKRGNGKKPSSPRNQFLSNILTTIAIFLLLVAAYSFIADRKAKSTEIPISQLASDISADKVSRITVNGDSLDVEYTGDETHRTVKKEEGVALTQTLANYGVAKDKLAKVQIQVESPNGLGYWILNLA